MLHEGCPDVKADPIYEDTDDQASCGCAQQFVTQECKKAVFSDLDCSQRYYPMIVLTKGLAVYGVSPYSIFPGERTESRRTSQDTTELVDEAPLRSKDSSCGASILHARVLQERQHVRVNDTIRQNDNTYEI
ncbi:hypothetical protein N7476_000300 [Penicillium atrosanguineum]|uniref:Uncharacterized protein n=1 Tax=Penicillium atrosanguineum TaxID=1132637 RepID=A0A9W9QGE0_9EURO|nr:hypothetical protein N7476_000300 [Penicillium atrosanguineum]